MPSLRKKVSTYFRQLSFHNEPRQKRSNINENSFVTKYLQGHISLKEGPPVIHGKNPTDLPNFDLEKYETGYDSIKSCYSGPHGGLTTIRRIEKHLSIPESDDFDFIDTQEEVVQSPLLKKSPKRTPGQPVDNTKMVIKVAGQEYFVKNDTRKHRKSQSLGSLSDFKIEIEKTKIDKEFYNEINCNNNCDENLYSRNSNKVKDSVVDIEKLCDSEERNKKNRENVEKKSNGRRESKKHQSKDLPKISKDHVIKYRPPKSQKPLKNESQRNNPDTHSKHAPKNFGLSKSKSEGNPFRHKNTKKKVETPKSGSSLPNPIPTVVIDDSNLPHEWNKKSDHVFGISDSLYDTNLVTKVKNGDPIADCFGVIARQDSLLLAVADGVNWGEKACLAAKSAIHGCLHYLNKTIFSDTKLFANLTVLCDQIASSNNAEPLTHISNTREVFVCLLRAFNCAHDLILENNGMLTTLTVAVVLPLSSANAEREGGERGRGEGTYVCCVCNVGDTLAYVYSSKYGVRELTKGSHDVNSNRDMRDALGALGPVDGINPELSNLTLSVTTVEKGDIVLIASDGLTDNFDPNVCKFTVNTAAKIQPVDNRGSTKKVQPSLTEKQQNLSNSTAPFHPVKPPRRSHVKKEDRSDSTDSNSVESKKLTENCASSLEISTKGSTTEEIIDKLRLDDDNPMSNPLVAHFMKQNSIEECSSINLPESSKNLSTVVENKTSSVRKNASMQKKNETPSSSQETFKQLNTKSIPTSRPQQGYSFLRSKTTIDFHSTVKKPILRNEEGIPYVTPVQRYELQLLLMEDVLKHGISGQELPCTISRKLCENLVDFTLSITAAKRRTLEDLDLYFDNRDGVLVEVSGMEKKQRRKKGLEKVTNLPGKLDHVTVVACNVGLVPLTI